MAPAAGQATPGRPAWVQTGAGPFWAAGCKDITPEDGKAGKTPIPSHIRSLQTQELLFGGSLDPFSPQALAGGVAPSLWALLACAHLVLSPYTTHPHVPRDMCDPDAWQHGHAARAFLTHPGVASGVPPLHLLSRTRSRAFSRDSWLSAPALLPVLPVLHTMVQARTS